MLEIIDWLRRIGGRDAMTVRQEQRGSGKINRPLRRASTAQWWTSHRLDCICGHCFPPELAEVRRMMVLAREGRLPCGRWVEPPVKVVRHRKHGKKQEKRSKWRNRGTSSN